MNAVNNIVGLPTSTLNSLQRLAESINSDAFFDTIMNAINLKSDLKYVNTVCDFILKNFLGYYTTHVSNI